MPTHSMHKQTSTHPLPRLSTALLALLAGGAVSASAGTITWANNASSLNWNDPASWNGGVPGADDIASIPKGGVRPALEAGETAAVAGVRLACKDKNYCHITGSGTLVLGAEGLSITVESGSGSTSGTIGPTILLAADQTWDIGGKNGKSTTTFTFNGNIGETGGSRALVFTSGGISVLNGADSDFSGGFTCLSGTLRIGAGSVLAADGSIAKGPLGTGPVTLGNIVISDTNKRTLHNPLTIAGDLTFSRDGQTSGYTITFAPTTTETPSSAFLHAETDGTQHTITLFNNRQKPTISQSLGESGAKRLGLVIQDGGTGKGAGTDGQMTLSGTTPNTFTGTVTVSGARLRLAKDAGVTAVPSDLEVNGGMLILGAAEQVADSAILRMGAEGVVSFEGATVETVRQLWVDGTRWLDGTYTSANASFLSGAGQLVVADRTKTTILLLQ